MADLPGRVGCYTKIMTVNVRENQRVITVDFDCLLLVLFRITHSHQIRSLTVILTVIIKQYRICQSIEHTLWNIELCGPGETRNAYLGIKQFQQFFQIKLYTMLAVWNGVPFHCSDRIECNLERWTQCWRATMYATDDTKMFSMDPNRDGQFIGHRARCDWITRYINLLSVFVHTICMYGWSSFDQLQSNSL